MRAAIHIFEQECFSDESSSIYITEQCTPLFQAVHATYPNLIGSEYLGDSLPFGTMDAHGIRNESITKLTFSTNTFDRILSLMFLNMSQITSRASPNVSGALNRVVAFSLLFLS